MSRLRPNVVAAKTRLVQGLDELRGRHQTSCGGGELCAAIAALRDEVLLDLLAGALESLDSRRQQALQSQIALVAHGGYGRREVAPFSDVDLMILREAKAEDVGPLAERFFRDVFDVGLTLGHSVRTPQEACQLSGENPLICTSLIESRLLAGSRTLFDGFRRRFASLVRRRAAALLSAMEKARIEERLKFGETAYLLEPNLKRSQGGLRDIHFVRWIGWARYGTAEPEQLRALGVLSEQDLLAIQRAREFLLWLRNEMHFHRSKPGDVLDRAEQVRLAERLGYKPSAGMLPVEQFMRDYFRHTGQVTHVVERFLAKARSGGPWRRLAAALLSRRIEGGFRVGPMQVIAVKEGRARLTHDLTAVLQLLDLANLHEKPIEPDTWELVRQHAPRLPQDIPPAACRLFCSLLKHPAGLGDALRRLHEVGLLERFIPAFAHARGLLQFNQYHKYTVDEHCLRVVDRATEFMYDRGPLGNVYRSIADKHVLHLALLIHDLGKGYPKEHCEVAGDIAEDVACRLELSSEEADSLAFLVRRHLLMNHLALRRDTSDEQLIVRFAAEVGSPELLRKLYVFTAADLGAVGPNVWTSWKQEIITDLYDRAMQHLAGESPGLDYAEHLQRRREAVLAWLGPHQHHPWFLRQVASLPSPYLCGTEAQQIAADLRLLHHLRPGEVVARSRYLPETQTVQSTVATSEDVTPGIFHKLTGALTSLGLQILSAQINTLADRLVLDRFVLQDSDYVGQPPQERLEQVDRALVESLRVSGVPTFRCTWRVGAHRQPRVPPMPTRALVDVTTSEQFTILDVFTHDRRGLLYAITRTLFELGLSVWRAKIGTYLDQVVDVFYLTDQDGHKVTDPARINELRLRVLDVIESMEKD